MISNSCRVRESRGFTLVEMLLVIVIIGIVVAVSVPQFVNSMQGNRRRTATRMVVAAGRYARSMAVLYQRPMALTFDLDQARLSVAEANAKRDFSEDGEEEEPFVNGERLPASAGPEALERSLDNISIASLEIEDSAAIVEGRGVVIYETNGRCLPYEVLLVDADGESILIKVDALASAETTRE